jgi:hypothetical protein
VKIAELEAEAQKARDVKGAEAQAQVRVLQAKAESDAMQYTLPLKQKQIEQTKLEAEARKEATLQNAEAAAQAKIIDSKAEVERQKNLSEAEANRIRVTAGAHEVRSYSAEAKPHADSENYRRAAFGQTANHDGSHGRQEFLCERRVAFGVLWRDQWKCVERRLRRLRRLVDVGSAEETAEAAVVGDGRETCVAFRRIRLGKV